MIPAFHLTCLSDFEISRIHDTMQRILSRTGMSIESEALRDLLAARGAETGKGNLPVRFPVEMIEEFLSRTPKPDNAVVTPRVSCSVGIYQGSYLDPASGRAFAFTDQTLRDYIKLARLLEEVDDIHVLNLPTAPASPVEPLLARLFAWKLGVREDGGIQSSRLCPYILEMYEIMSEVRQQPVRDIFAGGIFLISPLRLPAHEAEQLMYFHKRGLRVWISNMMTLGGQAPVTLAGAVALNLAERVGIGIINSVLFDDYAWSLESMIAPLDMRTMIQPYGRPESLLTGLASLQLARHYGVPGWAHTGLTDAKAPSTEAGAQKMMTALPCALAGGANVEPGLLSIDELFSPVQMILDAEIAGAIRRICMGFRVDEDTLAAEVIEEVGPGGMFTAQEHTSKHFRREIWDPSVWSRQMLSSWNTSGGRIDAARALDSWHDLMLLPQEPPALDEQSQSRLMRVVENASDRLS